MTVWPSEIGAVAASAASGVECNSARQAVEDLPHDRLLQIDENRGAIRVASVADSSLSDFDREAAVVLTTAHFRGFD